MQIWQIIDPQAVGIGIRKQRLAHGLSQEVVSGLAGIARSHLSAIERGQKKPTMETFCRIAYALRLKPSELMVAVERAEKSQQ